MSRLFGHVKRFLCSLLLIVALCVFIRTFGASEYPNSHRVLILERHHFQLVAKMGFSAIFTSFIKDIPVLEVPIEIQKDLLAFDSSDIGTLNDLLRAQIYIGNTEPFTTRWNWLHVRKFFDVGKIQREIFAFDCGDQKFHRFLENPYGRPSEIIKFNPSFVRERVIGKRVGSYSDPKSIRWGQVFGSEPTSLRINDGICVFQSGCRSVCSRFCSTPHGNVLSQHNSSLTINGLQSMKQEQGLKCANDDQQRAEQPICPIAPTFIDDHGGEFSDSYGLIIIFGCYLAMGFFIFWGGLRVSYGCRRSGWFVILLGLMLGGLACVSGIIGRLPWNWNTHSGGQQPKTQDQCQVREFHG